MPVSLSYAVRVDRGRARSINCDRVEAHTGEPYGGKIDLMMLVADGMGVTRGGQIAGLLVQEHLPPFLASEIAALPSEPATEEIAGALRRSVEATNLTVWEHAQADADLRGMGTTCVAIVVRAGVAVLCHVGDSRAYLLRDSAIQQITADHALLREVGLIGEGGRQARFGNVITRGIGLSRTVETDTEVVALRDGDTLLLCTDGLSNMAPDDEIARCLAAASDPDQAATALIELANGCGGHDNIGVAVLRYGNFAPYAMPIALSERRAPSSDAPDGMGPRARTIPVWSIVSWVSIVVLLVVLVTGLLVLRNQHEENMQRATDSGGAIGVTKP